MAYDDGQIACTGDALVIRKYYFPGGDKRVPYEAIERVRVEPMTGWSGAYRLWGSGDFVHWYNWDPDRPRKQTRIVVEIRGHRVKPVITPARVDDVTSEFTAHGVTVDVAV
jgi:hypothetical protein